MPFPGGFCNHCSLWAGFSRDGEEKTNLLTFASPSFSSACTLYTTETEEGAHVGRGWGLTTLLTLSLPTLGPLGNSLHWRITKADFLFPFNILAGDSTHFSVQGQRVSSLALRALGPLSHLLSSVSVVPRQFLTALKELRMFRWNLILRQWHLNSIYFPCVPKCHHPFDLFLSIPISKR